MDKYFINQPVRINIPLTSTEVPDAGDVTAVNYDVVRVAPTADDFLLDQSFDPQVNTSGLVTLNMVGGDLDGIRSVFQINYDLVTSAGTFSYSLNFIAELSDNLIVGSNSYQTYFDALLTAEDLAGTDHFKGAAKADQTRALAHAYSILNTMVYTDKFGEYYNLGDLDETALGELEPAFLQALCFAQVIEANEMLDTNSIYHKRQEGLMSETIGESSMMFRPGNILNFPITRRSLMFLRNYLVIRARLMRG